ncbi:hypothetical protein [Armatimonas sp.]|uniref:hypothetical protein n=1 Tax=Armatimonas sp. TaxID=1872638 RepID=UPI003751F21D
MQTQKNLLAFGLASVGMIASPSPSHAAPSAVNDIKEVTITTENAATRITITGSLSFTPEVKSLDKSGVTTITLPGLWQAGRAGSKSVQKNGVAFVRYGQYSMRPSKQVRIVANYSSKLRKGLKVELIASEDKTRWDIVLYAPGIEPSELTAREVLPVNLPSIAAAPPKIALALQAERDPLPGISVRNQRTRVSIDTRALMAAASRVASSIAFAPRDTAPLASYELLTAPQLSLASVLPLAPRPRPLVATTTGSPKLTPYSSRMSEPTFAKPLLPALAAPTPPLQKKAVVIPVKAPKATTPVATVVEKPAPTELKLAPTELTPTLAEPKPTTATPKAVVVAVQENALDRVVSLDFVSSELSDVLKLISVQAKVNVVSGQSIIGKKVTLSLQKVLLREALDWITRTSGVSYTMEGSNTIIVGTGQEIALLKRTNETPEAASANIPFFYADADSLKTALTAAFPNVAIHLIKASEESKKPEENTQQTQQAATGERIATGGGGAGGSSPSSLTNIKPRGGSLYVVSTRSIITELSRTIEDMEHGLIEIAQRDADRKSEQMRAFVNDTYEMKYVDPTQAARLVLESVPNLIIRPGPSQRFIATALGAIGGSFSQAGSSGGAGTGSAGAAGGTGSTGASSGGPGLVESRLLLLTGKDIDVKRAKEMLSQLDTRPPQFIYEARLVEVNKDDVSQLGLTYDLGKAIQIGENDAGGQKNTTVNSVPGGRNLNGGAIYRTPLSVAAKVDALATKGKANILARPTLSALDGNQAVTFIGDQVPYIISQSIGANGGLNIQTGIASAGIRLQVSGRSNGDGTMTIYVHPEISTITQFVGGLPQISTRFVDTTIRVKNGETIAIGGLVQKQEIDNMRKVPGLGDLPVLGQLFRSSDKRIKESEVLIFITCSLSKD